MSVANTLAYYDEAQNATYNVFKVQAIYKKNFLQP